MTKPRCHNDRPLSIAKTHRRALLPPPHPGRDLGLLFGRDQHSGLQTWTFWQNLSQLRECYPNDWESILNNSRTLQVFGITNNNMAKEWAELLGQRPDDLNQLASEEAAVLVQGQGSLVCRRPDYLKDEMFAGLFDANPRFALQGQPGRGQL